MSSAPPVAVELAGFVTALEYEDIPAKVVGRTKELVLDQLACELVGSTMPWVEPATKLVQLTQGVCGESSVVGLGRSFLAADAAFANATFGQACELDNSAYGSAGHAGTATIPVAMAMGEREGIDGRQFITAIVAGYDVMYRMMAAITPHHHARGFHSQSIAGPFGGAAVAGKILGLDQGRMVHALAIAGSHSCGPIEFDVSGGSVKRIHAGLGARGGIHSAQLAKFGLTGPATIVEGKRGFCSVFATQSDIPRITAGLGTDFSIINTAFKLYPAVATLHSPIAAIERLVAEHGFGATDVERIRVGMAEFALLHGGGITQPTDVLGAQFSLAFSLAIAVAKRSNDLSLYMNSTLWIDPELVGLMKRVETYADPSAIGEKYRRATVTVALKDGRSFEASEDYMRGTPPNPATREQHHAKVRGLAASRLSPAGIDNLIGMVEQLEELDDICRLADVLAPRDRR